MSARIGILGGSFNPVHIGHILLADYLVQFAGYDEVWLMLSPQNPLKDKSTANATDADRLNMLSIATSRTAGLKVCDIELTMPRPSYTIDSLTRLSELYPDCKFSLIIGSDNWLIFDRWKDYATIIHDYNLTVYPRPGYPIDKDCLPKEVRYVDAPTFNISSTFIRDSIAAHHDMTNFLPIGVGNYITEHKLYI